MKLSVSIPDELWIVCKLLRPDLKDSHIVQEALYLLANSDPQLSEALSSAASKIVDDFVNRIKEHNV